jgi:hypothetical protein
VVGGLKMQKPPKFCDDCKDHIPEMLTSGCVTSYDLCGRKKYPPFTPGFHHCSEERKDGKIKCRLNGTCGKEGRFYEKRW